MNNEKLPIPSNTLPLERSLKGDYVLTFIIALLMTGTSIAGLLASSTLYPIEELRNGFVTTDIINLLFVLPLLIGGSVLTRRGLLVGLIVWIGSLFVINYHYIAYATAHPMTWQFFLYVTLVGFTAWAIFSLIKKIDLPEIKARLKGEVPVRFTAGVLIVLGLLFLLRAGSIIVTALAAAKMLPPTEFADLLSSTIWIIGGVILWQKKALGYVVGAGLILQASVLFVGLLIYFSLQPVVANTPFPLEDFIVIFFMGWVCYIPFGLFVRGIIKRS
jgi:hypothetical protein